LRGKLHGARQHGEGVFFADAVEGGDGFQHGIFPRTNLLVRQFSPTLGQMQICQQNAKSPGRCPGLPSHSHEQAWNA
jgi:hypothetical protein